MRALRIVIVMIEPPLPFGNAAARWYYVLLKGLVERGHRVTAFATCSNPNEIEEASKLFPSPVYDLRCYAHPPRIGLAAKWETLQRPYSYMFSKEFENDLENELAKGFDILHLEQLWSGWMGLAHRQRALVNVLNLLSVDLEGGKPSPGLLASRWLARRAENKLLRSFPNICTLTSQLTAYARSKNPVATVHTVPLGIDMAFYPFGELSPPRPPVVSLIGSFTWYPTISAGIRVLKSLWPKIYAACPEARL